MGEREDINIFNGQSKMVLFDKTSGESKALGTVVNGLSVDTITDPIEIKHEAEQGEDVSHLLSGKNFSFSCKIDEPEHCQELRGIVRLLKNAEAMREDIANLIRAFGELRSQGKMNRRKRRECERAIAKKHKRLMLYCEAHNIQFSRK